MATTTETIEDLIRAAYQATAAHPGAWIKLTDLREAIGDVNRHQIDEDCAVWSGGEWNHLICIR